MDLDSILSRAFALAGVWLEWFVFTVLFANQAVQTKRLPDFDPLGFKRKWKFNKKTLI
jgi:hypothetical protein